MKLELLKEELETKTTLLEDAEDDEIAELQNKIAALQQQKATRLQQEAEAKAEEDKILNQPTKATNLRNFVGFYRRINDILKNTKGLPIEDRMQALFDRLVPETGPAGTIAGELVRAMMKVFYRDYNDGDVFYQGYGLETCAPAMEYIKETLNSSSLDDYLDDIAQQGLQDDAYTDSLREIASNVIVYIYNNLVECLKSSDDNYLDYDGDYFKHNQPRYEDYYEVPTEVLNLIDEYESKNNSYYSNADSLLENAFEGVSGWDQDFHIEFDRSNGSVYVYNMTSDAYDDITRAWPSIVQSWKDDLEYELENLDEEDEEFDEEE